MTNIIESRFITRNDTRTSEVIYLLPESWWSRFYEYAWASHFAQKDDVVLDAACGIGHPFKFYLAERTKSVFACDLDPRIEMPHYILADIADTFGAAASETFPMKYFKMISYKVADLTNLPYENQMFDKIFCISVLEHMSEEALFNTLKEFKHTLKPLGLVILTFDYPSVDFQMMESAIVNCGLDYVESVDFNIPPDAIHTDMYHGLYCFRMALKHAKA
ncbi:class I SAM-dependent methyltransferase [Alicyclobacillus tolerans]|uniref:class I SAM-dependent methyltransferase n=1 Tax=Alicyclobacillus tolerans TaxID=90970 RepID=UPI001F3383A8|nr:class I SAM-dependent methyltransferase [Alicyclobacillus tolerans]MCF8568338.1 class I SAM-dependent methyltransferase [Alicyclobacillus tolerans]